MASLQQMLAVAGSPEKAADMCRQMMAGGDLSAALDLSLVLHAMGDVDGAADALKAVNWDEPRADFARGWQKIREGRIVSGIRLMERGRNIGHGARCWGNVPPPTPKPRMRDGERGHGRFLLWWGEGGVGDEILGLRYVPCFADMGWRVIVACQQSLCSFVAAAVPGVHATVPRDLGAAVYHDAWVPAMRGPVAADRDDSEYAAEPVVFDPVGGHNPWPHLLEPPEGVRNIGVRWSGNPEFEHEQFRRFDPAVLLDRLRMIPDTRLVSFQRDGDFRWDIGIDLRDLLPDWLNTSRALLQCSVVVSSCTSVAHMAASLGVPTVVIVPVMCYYPWANGLPTSPYYPSVEVVRQKRFGDWDGVLEEAADAARRMLA